MPIPKYVSAEEYSRQSGMGVEQVKKLCRSGELEHYMTEGGYYKIKVFLRKAILRIKDRKIYRNKTRKFKIKNNT